MRDIQVGDKVRVNNKLATYHGITGNMEFTYVRRPLGGIQDGTVGEVTSIYNDASFNMCCDINATYGRTLRGIPMFHVELLENL